MLRELQALHDDPKMLQYAPRSLLPKMDAGRVDKEGQGMNQNKTWPWLLVMRAARAVVLSRVSKDRCHTNPDERIDQLPRPV